MVGVQVDSGPSRSGKRPTYLIISSLHQLGIGHTLYFSGNMCVYIDRCGEKETRTPIGENGNPPQAGEKGTPPGKKVTIFINAFLALAGLISRFESRRGGRWRRWTIAGGQASTTGATWLGGGVGVRGTGAGLGGGGQSQRAGFFWGEMDRSGWQWRVGKGGDVEVRWYDPMRTVRSKEPIQCGRFGVNNARVVTVKKVGNHPAAYATLPSQPHR